MTDCELLQTKVDETAPLPTQEGVESMTAVLLGSVDQVTGKVSTILPVAGMELPGSKDSVMGERLLTIAPLAEIVKAA